MAKPFLGRGQNTQTAARGGAKLTHVLTLEPDHASGSQQLARQGRQQFILPVARHATDAQNLARADLHGDVTQRHAKGTGRGRGQPPQVQLDRAGSLARAGRRLERAAHHHLRHIPCRRL